MPVPLINPEKDVVPEDFDTVNVPVVSVKFPPVVPPPARDAMV